MSTFDDTDIISRYTLEQASEDGVLGKIFKKRWKELSGGKPIVATVHLFEEVSRGGLLEIWNEYALWRRNVNAGTRGRRPAVSNQDERGEGMGDRGRCSFYPDVLGGLLVLFAAVNDS